MNTMVRGQVFEGVVVVDKNKALCANAFPKERVGQDPHDFTRFPKGTML